MTEIIINGTTATPASNASIKFTAENPFFTKSSSYTYSVELPLSIEENKRIFSVDGRHDTAKSQQRHPATIRVDNRTILDGEATIEAVTDTAVKVQILGENAAYNYGNKMDETYIDELDMGSWVEYFPYIDNDISTDGHRKASGYDTDWENAYGDKYPFVSYPTYNTSAEALFNVTSYLKENGALKSVRITYSYGLGNYTANGKSLTAAQPYFWALCEKIAQATGFTLPQSKNAIYQDPFLKRIFYANANGIFDISKMLPHWSVNEFWEQIENTFGVVLTIDYGAKELSLSKRADFFQNTDIATLSLVVDEISVEMDDDTVSDISVDNVGFTDYESGAEDILSEYIQGSAEYIDGFEDASSILNWLAANTDYTSAQLKSLVFCCDDNRRYIYAEDVDGDTGLVEVDMFRPRLTSDKTEDLDVEIKIVPAKFCAIDAMIALRASNGSRASSARGIYPYGHMTIKALAVPNVSDVDTVSESDYIDIESIISGEEDEDDSSDTSGIPDVMYMAIADEGNIDTITEISLEDGSSESVSLTEPRALLRERKRTLLDGTDMTEDPGYSLSLQNIEGQTNLYSSTIAGGVEIDTDVCYTYKFVCDQVPSPSSVFLIRNQRYVCKKIEANINADGLDKLMTGYFYRLK